MRKYGSILRKLWESLDVNRTNLLHYNYLYNSTRLDSQKSEMNYKIKDTRVNGYNEVDGIPKPNSYIILKYNNENEDFILKEVIRVLKANGAVALPTDTIYGIATLAQNETAVENLYSIKKRNPAKPIAICVGDISDIPKWSNVTVNREILEGLLPGPVTLFFNRSESLNPLLNTPLVGVRIPKHSFIQKLARLCGEPLALTSANISCHESTHTIQEFSELWPKLGLIIDGGPLGHLDPLKLGSTIVDLSEMGSFKIIRAGCAEKNTRDFLIKHELKER